LKPDEQKADDKKKGWEQGPEATDEEKKEVPDDIQAAAKRFTESQEWPAEGVFTKPPKDYDQMIRWTKDANAYHFTPKQRDYLYGMCEIYGLLELGKGLKDAEAKGEELDPRRVNIVAYALSQVGLVEAQVDSGEREPNPNPQGEEIQKCVGADRLWGYHE